MTVVDSAQRFAEASRTARPWRRWLLVALGVVILGAGVWAVWFSPLLSVSEVRVLGAESVPVDEIRAAADVDAGTPLARVDADGVAERVAAIPAIGSVEVRRGWPDVLVVVVAERTPVAVVRAGSSYAYVDATGTRFGEVATRPARTPLLRASTPEALATGAAVLASLPDARRATVTSATAKSRDDVVLGLDSGATVQWGSPQDAARKLAVLVALLPRKAAHYDVSAPDLPTTRGTLRR